MTIYEKEKMLSDSMNEIGTFITSKFNSNKKFFWMQYASGLNLQQEFRLKVLGTEFTIGWGITSNPFIFVKAKESGSHKNGQKYDATDLDKAILNAFRYFEKEIGF